MARFSCPQCGRRFGSVGEVLSHTQEVHVDEELSKVGPQPGLSARSMPSAEPGRVATERASEAEFETEAPGGNGTGSPRPGPRPREGGDEEEKQNPTIGTLIALAVIAIIIILNIIGGGGE